MKDLNAGTWIDREHATVFLVSAEANELEKFQVSSSQTFPETQASRAKQNCTRGDFVAEDKLGRAAAREKCTLEIAKNSFV